SRFGIFFCVEKRTKATGCLGNRSFYLTELRNAAKPQLSEKFIAAEIFFFKTVEYKNTVLNKTGGFAFHHIFKLFRFSQKEGKAGIKCDDYNKHEQREYNPNFFIEHGVARRGTQSDNHDQFKNRKLLYASFPKESQPDDDDQ